MTAGHQLEVVDDDEAEAAQAASSRRALARISMTVRLGLSSMNSGASPRRPMAWLILGQSDSSSLPLRIRVESTRASAHSRRWVISTWLISSEKNRTGTRASMAAWAAMPQGEGGLAHAGPGPDDDQAGGLQAGQALVEVEEAGGDAGDRLAPVVEGLEAVEGASQQLVEGSQGVGDPAFGHLEDHGLGPVDRFADVLGDAVAHLGDLAGDADEAAQQGVLLDDAGVAGGVGGRRRVGLQADEGGRARRWRRAVRPGGARRPR